jgi:tRNA threonylcarbamoyladenosine biosynthesis protein TsaB
VSRVVAIDTSTWWGGVALVEGEDATGAAVVAECGMRVDDSHALHVLSLLDRLLAEVGWAKSSVDAYAATRGPGSFTGIRIGLGTVRGLGVASGRPCLGVVSLAALAEAFGPAEADRSPLLDAGRGEVYGARYDAASSPPLERVAPWLGPVAKVLDAGGPQVVLGPGAERYRATLAPALEGRFGRSPRTIAAATGRLALARLAEAPSEDHGMSPLYLRPPDAELHAPAG